MKIRIGSFDYTEVWDGVLYKNLSSFPFITEWEIQNVLDFIEYERQNGRTYETEADVSILQAIENYRPVYESGIRVPVPEKITECTACPGYRGCLTQFICHTASLEDACSIFSSGKLLSAVKARKKPASQLKEEVRNAANDPEDYFEYVMFTWGNCQAGDRLVMERKLKRFPDEKDLSKEFTPGIRYYFRYADMLKQPGAVMDGVLPLKVKDEVILKDCLYAAVVPEEYRDRIQPGIPEELKDRTYFVTNDCRDIWQWSEKVYEFVGSLSAVQDNI